ncbi:polysaccharide deacetylase family protein [Sporosarcina sp. A2]|uniref:polysaccharide deacetylase family protein n=1 Tax=Sporosarcina sp. A2 TaxID=3393449 RepID=UPI003D793C8B
MRKSLQWAGLSLLAMYMLLPWILTRILNIGVFRRGRKDGRIAFTFDDGPDPLYTPKLLTLLKKHEVKATFFVLGHKANQHPDIIRRIHEEGHQIGIHNYTHRPNWLMMPWTTTNFHLKKTSAIIESITGTKPYYYRPPWGIINIYDLFFRKRYEIVLWSMMPGDWKRDVSRSRLKGLLLRNIKNGSVIVLHDSGDTIGSDWDAPKYMMIALDEVLIDIKQRGLHCVRIDEMVGNADVEDRIR